MKSWIALGILAGCGDAAVGPVPIALGEDACDHCRMIISEARTAAEARFRSVEKFDDIGCLLRRMKQASPTGAWVADHSDGRWIDAGRAWFVLAPSHPTPMASGLVAFSSRPDAESFCSKNKGKILTYDEALRTYR